jgi:hypothetical protein
MKWKDKINNNIERIADGLFKGIEALIDLTISIELFFHKARWGTIGTELNCEEMNDLNDLSFQRPSWSIAVETPQGVVGLWSCWLENEFYLGYPKRTSFLVDALPKETVIRIADKYCQENTDQFLIPPREDSSFKESRQLLIDFKETELIELLRQNGVKIPSFHDGAQITDQLIMDTLGVELARPVPDVETVVVGEGYKGIHKDPDKPLEKDSTGLIIAYHMHGSRLWAKFYGPRVTGKRGRVWVDHSDQRLGLLGTHRFYVVRDNSDEDLESICYGQEHSRGIFTYPFDKRWNKYTPDSPTVEPGIIQSYRNKFLVLVCEIAQQMGGAKAVNIHYDFNLSPCQLKQLGYDNAKQIKGKSSIPYNEMVRMEKTMENGNDKETIIIVGGVHNDIPWTTIRRVSCVSGLTVEKLIELIEV